MQAELDEQRRAIEEAEAASQASLEARQVHTASIVGPSSPFATTILSNARNRLMGAQHLRAVTKHPVEGASPARWLQCLQRELSTTISSLLDQFVGDQRAAMGSAFEAARAHASVASTANTDNATCMAGIATAMTDRLQVQSSCSQRSARLDCSSHAITLHRPELIGLR